MGVGLWIAAALLASPGQDAQAIQWDAAEGCPSQAAVAAATREFLGGRALTEFSRSVSAQAWVEPDAAGYRLRLTITMDGTREHHQLRAVDCDQLGRDAALLIASAVDPFALGPPVPAPTERQLSQSPVTVQRPRTVPKAVPSEAVVAREPVSASEPVEPTPLPKFDTQPSVTIDRPSPPDRTPKRPIAGTLAIAGTGFVGLFPQIGGGVELEGGLQRGLFRWQLGAAGWFGGRFRATGADVGADLSAVTGATGFCVAPSWRTVRFSACAATGVGVVIATGINTQANRTRAQPWAFAGPDLRVTWSPRPRVGVFVGVAALAALVRPGWSISNPDASYRVPPVLGLLRVGVELGQLGTR